MYTGFCCGNPGACITYLLSMKWIARSASFTSAYVTNPEPLCEPSALRRIFTSRTTPHVANTARTSASPYCAGMLPTYSFGDGSPYCGPGFGTGGHTPGGGLGVVGVLTRAATSTQTRRSVTGTAEPEGRSVPAAPCVASARAATVASANATNAARRSTNSVTKHPTFASSSNIRATSCSETPLGRPTSASCRVEIRPSIAREFFCVSSSTSAASVSAPKSSRLRFFPAAGASRSVSLSSSRPRSSSVAESRSTCSFGVKPHHVTATGFSCVSSKRYTPLSAAAAVSAAARSAMVTEQTRRVSLSLGSESIATARTPPYVENTWCMAFSSMAVGTPATRSFALEGSNETSSSGHSVERKISAAWSPGAASSASAAAVARFSDLNESTAAPPAARSRNRTETISVDDTIPEPFPLSPPSQYARIAISSLTSDGSGATSTWISPPSSSSSSSAGGGASVAGGGGGTSVVAPSAVCSLSAGGGGTSVVPSAAAGGGGTSCVAAGGAGTSRGGAGTSRSAGASAAPGASAAREATSCLWEGAGREAFGVRAVRRGTRSASAGDGRSTDVVERCRVRSCRRDRDSKSIRTSSRRARSAGLVPVVSSPASSSRPRISPTFSALRAFSVSGISIGSRSGRRGDVVARQTMTAKPCASHDMNSGQPRAPLLVDENAKFVGRDESCRLGLGRPQRQRALVHARGCVSMRCDA